MRGRVPSVESLPEDKNELKTMETLNDLLLRTEKMKAMNCVELEVGGNTNFLIAARKLGLKAVSLGQIGSDFYGTFMKDVLQNKNASDSKVTRKNKTLVLHLLLIRRAGHWCVLFWWMDPVRTRFVPRTISVRGRYWRKNTSSARG